MRKKTKVEVFIGITTKCNKRLMGWKQIGGRYWLTSQIHLLVHLLRQRRTSDLHNFHWVKIAIRKLILEERQGQSGGPDRT